MPEMNLQLEELNGYCRKTCSLDNFPISAASPTSLPWCPPAYVRPSGDIKHCDSSIQPEKQGFHGYQNLPNTDYFRIVKFAREKDTDNSSY